MIRALQVFETADGKQFDTESKALEHVVDSCREIIEAQLQRGMKCGRFTANDIFMIVMALVPNMVSAECLIKKLNALIDY